MFSYEKGKLVYKMTALEPHLLWKITLNVGLKKKIENKNNETLKGMQLQRSFQIKIVLKM